MDGLDWAPINATNGDAAIAFFPANLTDDEIAALRASIEGRGLSPIAEQARVITAEEMAGLTPSRTGIDLAEPKRQRIEPVLGTLADWLTAHGGAARAGRLGAGQSEQALTFFGWPHWAPNACVGGSVRAVQRITQFSPVALVFITADGRRFGFDARGEAVQEVEGAFATRGPDGSVTYSLPVGSYSVEVTGTGTGPATLELQGNQLPGGREQLYTFDAVAGTKGTFAWTPAGGPQQWNYGERSVARADGLTYSIDGLPAAAPTDKYTRVTVTITDQFHQPLTSAKLAFSTGRGAVTVLTDRSGQATFLLRPTDEKGTEVTVTVPGAAAPQKITIAGDAPAEPRSLEDIVMAAFDNGTLISGEGRRGGGGGGGVGPLAFVAVLIAGGVAAVIVWQRRRRTPAGDPPATGITQ
jgi:hypothetical protein